MSYPPPQNPYEGGNPYQRPPQQPPPQQPYGYPQQPQGGFPQQPAQPGYGFPQGGFQQPVQGGYPQQPGFNYPNAPVTMPGTVNAVRIILFIMGGLGILGAIGNFVQAAMFSANSSDFADVGAGLIVAIGVFGLIVSAGAIFLATQFNTGGNGVRIWTIVYGSLMALGGLISLIVVIGIVPLALGILIIVFMAKEDGSQWFNRTRY
ncbi:hypothetical protein [Streptomyces marispadix]|uniref:DUF4064 domain-containing protein n=1 Tax=Streptomyces marispadix TaxID=2922868 RepID=A0ABS9T0X1_9ACTN|nr:hypothetical protein [Streptomyces marispadix]MCH6162162.1 hypothetical protein [Streptomyces marispadix]